MSIRLPSAPTLKRHARLLALLALPAALGACGSDLPITTRSTPYTGPAATIDSAGRTHAIVIQAPTPGHMVSLDTTQDRLGGREALVTIRRPDPRYLVPQMIVEQRIGTDVPSSTPLDLFIRMIPHDSRENIEYVYVATSGTP